MTEAPTHVAREHPEARLRASADLRVLLHEWHGWNGELFPQDVRCEISRAGDELGVAVGEDGLYAGPSYALEISGAKHYESEIMVTILPKLRRGGGWNFDGEKMQSSAAMRIVLERFAIKGCEFVLVILIDVTLLEDNRDTIQRGLT